MSNPTPKQQSLLIDPAILAAISAARSVDSRLAGASK